MRRLGDGALLSAAGALCGRCAQQHVRCTPNRRGGQHCLLRPALSPCREATMGRKRPAQRPELAGRAADVYTAVEAVRYDIQNQRMQAELAAEAAEALMLVCARRPRRHPARRPAGARWQTARRSKAATHCDAKLVLGLYASLQDGAIVLGDLGCGSGLSTAALRQAAGPGVCVVGSDASPAMLAVAPAPAGVCAGAVVLSDFGQGLPFRSGSLDAAISISAVQARNCQQLGVAGLQLLPASGAQLGGLFIAGCTSFNHCHTYLKLPMQWLFRGDHPPAQIHTFFSSLHRCLKPGARAALQVYVEGQSVGSCPTVSSSHPAGCMFRICHIFSSAPAVQQWLTSPHPICPADDSQAQELVAGARGCGLDAGFFVSFPHIAPAKK